MALVSVYDLDGKEHKRETVDARELVAIGWTREPKEPAKVETVVDVVEFAKEPMTSSQLREALNAAGVEYRTNASKAELQALFDGI